MTVTSSRAREDRLLSNVSQKREVQGLIADKVLTFVQVVKTTGKIGKYGTEHLRIEHDIVGGDQPYPRVTASTKSYDSYLVEKHGLSMLLSEEDIENEEQPFDARKDASGDLIDKISLGKEFAVASQMTSTTVMTNNVTLSGTDQYNDYANSDPLGDWAVAKASVFDNSGQITEAPGGFGVMSWPVYNTLKFHPDLLDVMKHTVNMKKGLSFEQMADVMGVNRLLLAFAQYDTSKEGQTASITTVWGKNIVFGYAPLTGSKRIKTLGFRVQRKRPRRVFVDKVVEPPGAELIQVDDSYDFLLTDVGAGYLIKDAIA